MKIGYGAVNIHVNESTTAAFSRSSSRADKPLRMANLADL